MTASIDLDFGTFNLDASANNITISSIDEKIKKTVNTSDIPKTDGSIAETGRLRELQITVSGDVAGTSYENLRTNLDALKAALNNGFQKFTKDDERYVMAQLKDFSYKYAHLCVIATWKATFIAHYPFWLSETIYTDTRTPTSGSGYTIANSGNAPTRVKIEVTAPAGGIANNFCFENTTRSEICKFTGTIAASKVLEIDNRVDTDDFEVLNDGVDAHQYFEGDFINLSPGNNTIEFNGTANASIKLSYQYAWY
jgi:phage-related protein